MSKKPGRILPPDNDPFDYITPKEAIATALVSLGLVILIVGVVYWSVVD